MTGPAGSASPAWGSTTKLVVALTIVAIAAGLFVQFHGIIGPILMAFVLAYLLSPLASGLQKHLHFSWPIAVTVIYLIMLLLVLGMLTLGGLGLVQQIESLVSVVQSYLVSLPDTIQNLSGQVYQFGPFQLDFRHLDTTQLSTQLLGIVQPLLGSTGTLLAAIAGGAASFLGWTLFIMIVSYFVMVESGGFRNRMVQFDVPGYADDISHLGVELSRIWNAFLRGQIIIFLLTVLTYTIVLSILGVRYALAIALLAGVAKFLPYVGPFIAWTTLGLVAYFQPSNVYGMGPLAYAGLAVILAILIDQTFDNMVAPRIVARALQVHPAAVLIAAIIALNLLGVIGVIVAAPILATVALFWRYILRKLLDLDPWPEGETPPPAPSASRILVRIRQFWRDQRKRLT